MYVQGYVIPVPADKKDAYRETAEMFWPKAQAAGAIEQVEAWEADVPDGKLTDFRKAVAGTGDEKIVFSWVTWPDRASADKFNEQMMNDPDFADMDMPFDGKRMIWGGFDPIVERRR